MAEQSPIRVGSRVYLALAIAGDPGCVIGFDRRGWAIVEWPDVPEFGCRPFDPAHLVIDEAFQVRQLGLDFEEVAA